MKFSKSHFRKRFLSSSISLDRGTKSKQQKGAARHALRNINDSDVELPPWFLENCVLTTEELEKHNVDLVVRERAARSDSASNHEEGPNVAEDTTKSSVYEVESVVYKSLLDVMLDSDVKQHAELNRRCTFSNDAILLRFPDMHKGKGCMHFLTAMVQQFAQDAKANLITMDTDDLVDLAQHFDIQEPQHTKEHKRQGGDFDDLELDFEHEVDMDEGHIHSDRAKQSPHLSGFPFAALVSSPDVKRLRSSPSELLASNAPLIVHLKEAFECLDVYRGLFLTGLRDTISKTTANCVVIASTTQASTAASTYRDYGFGCGFDDFLCCVDDGDLYTDPCADTYGRAGKRSSSQETRLLQALGSHPRKEAICVAPVRNEAQQDLFEAQRKLQDSHEEPNKRFLQRSMRQKVEQKDNHTLLIPYVTWNFLQDSSAQKRLAKSSLRDEEVEQAVRTLGKCPNEARIVEAILDIGKRKEALDKWCDSEEDKNPGRWSAFPTKVQDAIKKIEGDSVTYKWERKFLDLLINPDELEEGWADIALDDDIKRNVLQLIHQPMNAGTAAYGILKKGRVGGTLLYGPPGTGKTHLARILAHEIRSVMLSVSAAEIQDMYVGETEKAIKGLFNVGRMLSPCTIFIDEADTLFRARQSGDRSWERSQTNQLLFEMDSLKKSRTPPFVLIATNHPGELDLAVLRRVPSRIYIGLPSTEHRHEIFQICLKDESLDTDVIIEDLAAISRGYSGSDIQTVCVQAALNCDTYVEGGERKRLLKHMHFMKAFDLIAPTVTKSALFGIKAFAKEYDPSALDRIDQLGVGDSAVFQKQNFQHRQETPKMSNLRSEMPSFFNYNTETTLEPSQSVGKRNVGAYFSKTQLSSNSPFVEIPRRVEELDSDQDDEDVELVDSEATDTGNGFHYSPLKPNSKQIRVLAIDPIAKAGKGREKPLRCTLKNVDLDDGTLRYQMMSSMADSRGLPTSKKYRLAMWHFGSAWKSRFDKDTNDTAPEDIPWEDLFKDVWSRLVVNNDVPFQNFEKISDRFNWGDYIALSYVWGDSKPTRDILLNGHRFPVTVNLYQALLSLRESFEVQQMGVHIWVDAICINQDDIHERAAEVKKMDLIYTECLAVRAWLGHPTSDGSAAVPLIRDILDAIGDTDLRELQWDQIERLNVDGRMFPALLDLFSAPFWQRLWTLQEVALAPSLLFFLGKQYFNTADFAKLVSVFWGGLLAEKFGHWPTTPQAIIEAGHALIRLIHLRPQNIWCHTEEAERVEIDIINLVRLAQGSKATDVRDKVYGLLALLPKAISAEIQPSYDPSNRAQHTFASFSKLFILHQGNIDFLARIRRQRFTSIPDLPSWALDLEAKREVNDATMSGNRRRQHGANVGMRSAQLTFSEDGQIMFCQGTILDTISSLGSLRSYSPAVDAVLHYAEAGKSSLTCSTHQDWRLALARVLMQNSFFEFSDAPSPLDIPWIEDDGSDFEPRHIDFNSMPRDIRYYHFSMEERQWQRYIDLTPLHGVFQTSLWENGDFNIGGQQLRDFFPAPHGICPDPDGFMELAHDLLGGICGQRLCTTDGRLLGSAPVWANVGDKVAVLSNCDMPMVLRPKENCYELIGSCFVEGLMKGEAGNIIDHCQANVEMVSIC